MGSNPRYDMGIMDPSEFSTVDGSLLDDIEQFGQVHLIKTAGAETRLLPAPTEVGQLKSIVLHTDGGNCVITAAEKINQTGNTVMTFADEGDAIHLISILTPTEGLHWRVLSNDGVALS